MVTGLDHLLAHENTSILRITQGFWLTDHQLTNVEEHFKAKINITTEITSASCGLGKDVAEPDYKRSL